MLKAMTMFYHDLKHWRVKVDNEFFSHPRFIWYDYLGYSYINPIILIRVVFKFNMV